MVKKLGGILAVGILVVFGVLTYKYFEQQKLVASISSFEQCAKRFPIMESYPPRCMTPDGRSFTQDIGNEMEYKDEIQVANPRPNQLISNPLSIHGMVSGRWLFEASFNAELFDSNNVSLGTAVLTAEGEWMTIELVPFRGELSFTKPTTETGTLKIMNANPSGLPENEYTLTIPVAFQ